MIEPRASDLLTKPPEYWARTASREELHRAARAVTTWTEEVAEVLDHAYLERSLRLLGRARDGNAAADLAADLQRVAHDRNRAELDALDRPYFARWRMLGELLLRSVQAAEVPTGVLARKHVRAILRAVHAAGGHLAQAGLASIIGNAGQLSATLALMEDWDLIDRAKHGTANTVALTDLGRLAIAPAEAGTEAAPDARFILGMTAPMSLA